MHSAKTRSDSSDRCVVSKSLVRRRRSAAVDLEASAPTSSEDAVRGLRDSANGRNEAATRLGGTRTAGYTRPGFSSRHDVCSIGLLEGLNKAAKVRSSVHIMSTANAARIMSADATTMYLAELPADGVCDHGS